MNSSTRNDHILPSIVYVYDEPSSPSFKIGEIADFLKEKLPNVDVMTRKEFFSFHTHDLGELAKELASAKVRGIEGLQVKEEPLYGEVQYEKRILQEPHRRTMGILYDGYKMLRVLREVLPENEATTDTAHIAFTNRIICTYEKGDNRFHARVIMCGFPSLISTSGLIEAPAKPREYYLMKQKYAAMDSEPPAQELKAAFEGRFIDYDDENMTQALKGYTLQSIFYHTTGEPFCEDKDCMLFNAHWQEEVLNAQIVSGQLCERHGKMLEEMVNGRRE
ncbi:MAG: hypothetical protein KAR39_05705 [Thermoplasmata archaeon]|nr:hypothetical protein [Thermoplasmata archaeon]